MTETTSSKPPESSAAGNPWYRVLALLFIACALLLSLELGARLIARTLADPALSRLMQDYQRLVEKGPSWIRFVPDETISYRLRPGFTLPASDGSGDTVHNAAGFRNRAPFEAKSPSTLRIACYGGSTTYGVGVEDNDDTYPARLRPALLEAARAAGWADVEVLNLGVGGYTSRQIRETMARTLPELSPDIVLLQNAINDVIPRFYPDFQADYSHFRTPFSPVTLSAGKKLLYRSHAWLIVAHAAGWIRPLSLQSQTQRPMPPVDEALANLEKNPPDTFEANVRSAVALARESGAGVWLLTQPYLDIPDFAAPTEAARQLENGYRRGLGEHTTVLRKVADSLDVGLIPLHESMPRQRELYTDPIHMSVSGNRVKAEQIAEALRRALPVPPVQNGLRDVPPRDRVAEAVLARHR